MFRTTTTPVTVRVKVRDELLDVEVMIRQAERSATKTRVYVSLDAAATGQRAVDGLLPRDDAGKIRYTVRGDFPDVDLAFDRSNRYQSRVWREVAEATFAVWDAPFAGSFSRSAGCTCTCSPGFVLRDSRGLDVWLMARVVAATPAVTTS